MVKNLIETILKYVVEHPEEIRVTVIEGASVIIVELKVAKEDLGKVIGKEGNMAKALRTILSNAASKQKKKAILQIIE